MTLTSDQLGKGFHCFRKSIGTLQKEKETLNHACFSILTPVFKSFTSNKTDLSMSVIYGVY